MLLALECGYVFSCKHTGNSRIFKRVVRIVKHVEIPAGKLTCDYTLLLFVKVDDDESSQLQVECAGGANTRPWHCSLYLLTARRGGIVCIGTRLWAGGSGVPVPVWARYYYPKHPDRFWGLPNLPFSEYWDYTPGMKRPERVVNHSHLVPRLRVSGAVPVLPCTCTCYVYSRRTSFRPSCDRVLRKGAFLFPASPSVIVVRRLLICLYNFITAVWPAWGYFIKICRLVPVFLKTGNCTE